MASSRGDPRDQPFASEGGAEFAEAYDWEHFREHGHRMVDFIVGYYKNIEKRPVKSQVSPGYLGKELPSEAPEDPEEMTEIMADIERTIMPGVTHWQHPSFFAFFPANSSYPGLLGEMLSGMFNVIGFSWTASPAATELETLVLDWLGKLIGLPPSFLSEGTGGGVIQGTASEATLVAVLAARARALHERTSREETEQSFVARLRVYASDQAHSSVTKACMIAGIPVTQFRSVPTRGPSFAMSPSELEAMVEEDLAHGNVPLICIATVGTTSSGAFDPLDPLGDVCTAHGMWMHVDAAWAGSAMICDEFRHHLNGVEKADSIDFNPHKWLLTNFDCSTMWVQNRKWLLEALSLTPEYLRSREYDSGLVSDYRDWQVPLGRRFRALKLWLVLRCFGAKRLRQYIREHVALAEEFAELVRADDRFEIVTPQSLSLVCFRLKASNEANDRLLERANATGRVYMVNTKLEDKFVLRCAVGNPRTDRSHIHEAWGIISEAADAVLADTGGE